MDAAPHAGQHRPRAPRRRPGQPLAVSASVAGADGSTQLRVSRYTETARDASGTETVMISAAGAVDMDTVGLLEMALLASVARHPRVCCDLSELTFFSAAGANALVTAYNEALEDGCQLSLRGVHGVVRRVLQITELDHLIAPQA